MMFWNGGHWAFWQMGLMWVGMIAFWGLLIWGVYALVTSATRKPDQRSGPDQAQCILDERLARGEIDADEYQRLRDVISSGHAGTAVGTSSGR